MVIHVYCNNDDLFILLTKYQCFLIQIAKKDVNTSMSKVPPVVPSCVFIANWVSQAGKPPVKLNLEVKLSGSKPPAVNFLVDVQPQKGA